LSEQLTEKNFELNVKLTSENFEFTELSAWKHDVKLMILDPVVHIRPVA